MIRSEDEIRDALGRLVPYPAQIEGNWNDALSRARALRARRRTRALVLAFTLAACAIVVSFAAAAGRLSGFSSWLDGLPGPPASRTEQQAFDLQSSPWLNFPNRPSLRELIEATVHNVRYKLYGFEAGGAICLRLSVESSVASAREPDAISCAPVSELQASRAPALAVLVDHWVSAEAPSASGGVHPVKASMSFGFVASGVDRITLRTNRGWVDARIETNAFLAIETDPKIGERTRALVATDEQGKRATVPIAEAPFDTTSSKGTTREPPGPTTVERHVKPTITWINRRENRGTPVATSFGLSSLPPPTFARELSPDPASPLRVVVSVQPDPQHGSTVCVSVSGGGGCSPENKLFGAIPFLPGFSTAEGGDQYTVMSGLAADQVARLEAVLQSGERRAIPLKDNVFLAQLPRAQFPIRMIAYDDDDRIIGILTSPRDV